MAERSWEKYAARLGDGEWTGVGSEWYARQYSRGGGAVPVTVIEDPEGDYLGWIDAEDRGAGIDTPTMIQRKEIFSIQFPYPVKDEEAAGHGTVIRLRIEEREA